MSQLINGSDVIFHKRNDEENTSNEEASIGWAVNDVYPNALPCGFGRLHNAECPIKQLDYDEVLYLISGELEIQINGQSHQAKAGDVFNLKNGDQVKYIGKQAVFFFVTSPTY
ncbi:hypothetical protein [Acinetobacter pittii]|uniref:hypothetical protein n=1 Tax=Acinetobacter pittii TaxID=48296 RepID=UPI00192CD1D1|nr:hypothetical protein [Acinetobacter pittii]